MDSIKDVYDFTLSEASVKQNDTTEEKWLYFEGIFSASDSKNRNGRIYPKAVWENNLKESSPFMEKLKNKAVLGELEHPQDGETKLSRVSHQFLDAKLQEDGTVWAAGRVLNTPAGRILSELFAAEYPVKASSRGQGTSETDDKKKAEVVQDDYELETWDFVYRPSVYEVETKVVSSDRVKELESVDATPVSIYESYGCSNGDNKCVLEAMKKETQEDDTEFCLECYVQAIEEAETEDMAEGIYLEALSKVDNDEDSEIVKALFKALKKTFSEKENIMVDKKTEGNEHVVNTKALIEEFQSQAAEMKARAEEAEAALDKMKAEKETESYKKLEKEYKDLEERYSALEKLSEGWVKILGKYAEEEPEYTYEELKERYDAAVKIGDNLIERLKLAEGKKKEQDDEEDPEMDKEKDKEGDDKEGDDKKDKDSDEMYHGLLYKKKKKEKKEKKKEDEEDKKEEDNEQDKKESEGSVKEEDHTRKFSDGNTKPKINEGFVGKSFLSYDQRVKPRNS